MAFLGVRTQTRLWHSDCGICNECLGCLRAESLKPLLPFASPLIDGELPPLRPMASPTQQPSFTEESRGRNRNAGRRGKVGHTLDSGKK